MKKTFITIICIMASLSGCGQTNSNATKNTQTMNNSIEKQAAATEQPSPTAEEGVVINGVTWATRNVDMPKTFAATPESFGKFYQWNRKVAWVATGEITGWDNSILEGTEWAKANDPSPVGWRVPTIDELKSLFDKEQVSNERTTENGVNGRKFTDKASGKSIFLPAACYRGSSDGELVGAGDGGNYWSGTQDWYIDLQGNRIYVAYGLGFSGNYADCGLFGRSFGFSVRCVAE